MRDLFANERLDQGLLIPIQDFIDEEKMSSKVLDVWKNRDEVKQLLLDVLDPYMKLAQLNYVYLEDEISE